MRQVQALYDVNAPAPRCLLPSPSSSLPRRPVGRLRALGTAWSLILDDPIGFLIPSAFALSARAASLIQLFDAADPLRSLTEGLICGELLTAPFRAFWLTRGARSLGWRSGGLRRTAALVVVELLVQVAVLGAALPVATLAGLGTAGSALAGLTLVPLLAATAAGVLASAMIRVATSYCSIEALLGTRGTLRAPFIGVRISLLDLARVGPTRLALDLAIVAATTAFAVGGVLALPLADLTLLTLWLDRTPRADGSAPG